MDHPNARPPRRILWWPPRPVPLPGPTIEVQRGRSVRIEWENGLERDGQALPLPYDVVRVPELPPLPPGQPGVNACWYRLRLLNGSSSRIYRFSVHDTTDEKFTPGTAVLSADGQALTFEPVAKLFDDTLTIRFSEGDWAVWNIVHLGGPAAVPPRSIMAFHDVHGGGHH